MKLAGQLAAEEGFVLLQVTVLTEKPEALSQLGKFRSAAEALGLAGKLAERSDNPYCEAKVLRRMGVFYERVELYGASLSAFSDAAGIFGTFDSRGAAACRRSRDRMLSVVESLKSEEDELCRVLALPGPHPRAAARRQNGSGKG